MNNQEKLERLKLVLRETKTTYWENVRVSNTDVTIPLFLPNGRIAVRIGDDNDWYRAVCRFVRPVIIRDEDTAEFVIEKISNTYQAVAVHYSKKVPHYFTERQRSRYKKIKNFLQMLRPERKVINKLPKAYKSNK